ncbi:putative aarF domain-containing protein kinase At1g71810, chloroplastic isoform X4 [Nicotiana tabacum]|uniref:AarF domain-containing protein kinase At1g71810, chloroplastic isoform X4 n=1 Tax=Nicotiana tabacum TaxID=4097 RepID=A0AC58SVB1_TOBAC
MYYVWSNFQPYITVLTDTEAKILSLRHNMLALRPQPSPLLAGTSFSDRSFRRLFQRRKVNSTSRCAALPVAAVAREVDDFTKYSGYVFELNSADEESLTEYNIAKIAAFYQKKPLIVVRRLVQIGSTLGKWFAVRYMDIVNERADEMFKIRAAELRKILVQLGPAYVKIAQAISSRPDLVPPLYLDELSQLQDRITPFSSEVAFQIIEKELGMPLDVVFSEISPEPVAAASLGQVYQARLRSSGQVVAVKVQRPGVRSSISLDILILRYLAGLIRRAGKLNTDLQAVIDEWASSLFREMDYKQEARNGVKFRQLYGVIQDVVVPEMYLAQTTRKVLTMQWIEGQKLAGVKDLYLVEVGVYCSFNQLLEYGFYHADPHPGNLFRTYDGKLAYLDFGMMGEFKQEFRDGFIEACLHFVNRDYSSLAKDFVTLGLIPPTSDKAAVTEALTGVFRDAVAKGVRNVSFGDLLGDLGITMYKFKFQIPSYFSLVIRSLAVLEGIAIGINPEYKVLGSTYPWIARKVLTDSSPKLKASLRALLYKDGQFRIDRLESLLSESLRAKTERTLINKQNGETDSKVIIKQILSFTLDDKGAFVRELLLEEFAKGMDALGIATLDSVANAVAARLPFSPSRPSSLTDEDITNLRNLQRLILLISGLREAENPSMVKGVSTSKEQMISLNGVPVSLQQFEAVQELLPLLSVLPELPQDMQQRLLLLPADFAGKLASRVAARTLQRVFL